MDNIFCKSCYHSINGKTVTDYDPTYERHLICYYCIYSPNFTGHLNDNLEIYFKFEDRYVYDAEKDPSDFIFLDKDI